MHLRNERLSGSHRPAWLDVMEPETIYSQLAVIFDYPQAGYIDRVHTCASAILSEQPQAAVSFAFVRPVLGALEIAAQRGVRR